MKRRSLFFIGLFAGVPQLGACNDTYQETADVNFIDYSAVVNELSWKFNVTSEEIERAEQEGSSERKTLRLDFVSKEPIKNTPNGNLYLRADLTVTEYSGKDAALNEWAAMIAKAHPDMGLSYAWDHLILNGQKIYHLHAACTFSEENMDVMTFNLRSIVVPDQHNVAPTIHCRCGSGCIVSGDELLTVGH